MLRVSKRFTGQPQVLCNISLSIHRGEFVSIEGAAGAGKSTLLRLMGLWDKPSHGQMVVDGADVSSLYKERAFARARRLICLKPTDGFFPRLNLKDNLRMAMEVARPPAKPSLRQCMEALAFVGLEKRWHQKPQQLLPSQRLRLLLARALIRQPRLLLVDACMDNMAEAELKSWLAVLQQCHERGATVVVAGERGLEKTRRLRLEEGTLHAA